MSYLGLNVVVGVDTDWPKESCELLSVAFFHGADLGTYDKYSWSRRVKEL